jgi:hypothetical protein
MQMLNVEKSFLQENVWDIIIQILGYSAKESY